MIANLDGERCPFGAGKDCLCSQGAKKKRQEAEESERKQTGGADRFFAYFILITGFLGVVSWWAVDSLILHPRPLRISDLAKSLFIVLAGSLLMRVAVEVRNAESAKKGIANRELREMQCAVRMLARRVSDENREGTDLHNIHKKLDALMREVELMRRGE